jgi:hypothetical protein
LSTGIRTNMLFTVWGESFIDKFRHLTMASLLSPENLPKLARTHQLHLMFYTDLASVAYLRKQTAPLTAYADLSITAFEDTTVDGRRISESIVALHGPAIKHELERLVAFHAFDTVLDRGEGDTLFIVPSDLIASDGSFARAQALLDDGAEAVAPPVLRLAEQSFHLTEDQILAGVDDVTICREMPNAFQHITRNCIATSESFSAYPASILWPVDDEGYVCRTFFPFTLAFKPRASCRRFDSTIDYDFLLNLVPDPEKIIIPASSAEICAVKVSKDNYMLQEPSPNRLRGAALSHFMLTETNKAHRSLFSRSFRLSRSARDLQDHESWDRTETESLKFANSAYGFIDEIIRQLPADTPGLAPSIRSHFGNLDEYLSPMRRAAK